VAAERARRNATRARKKAAALRREQASYAELLDAIKEVYTQPMPKITPPKPQPRRGTVLTPVLLLSDLHAGVIYDAHKMGALGRFDETIFAERISQLATEVIQIVAGLRATHTVNRIVLACAGDYIDGRTVHKGQLLDTVPLVQQVRFSTEAVAQQLIAPLARAFSEIRTVSVPGNHGRVGERGELDFVGDNLDVLWLDTLALRCQGISNIRWDRTDGAWKLFTLHGHRFLLHHGDTAKGPAHTPVVGARNHRRNFESVAHTKVDVTLSGHLHAPGLSVDGYSYHISNGCLPGPGSYGVSLGLTSAPSQTLITVTDQQPVAGHYPIQLATRDELLTIRPIDFDVA
jgi:predicted phosphodiesterase